MLAQPTRKHLKRLVAAAVVLTLVGIFIAPTAFARITFNTIDPVAIVTDNGRHIIVTGPLVCTAGERAHLRVTVTQRATGAVAEGRTLVTCTGGDPTHPQQWEVHASVQDKETFEEGSATAVALDRTTTQGDTTDAHQWLVEITLVGE
jgi:hypothetical protein